MTFHVCEVQDCHEAEVAVLVGKVAKTCLFRRVTRCAHVVSGCGALWHSTCVRCAALVRLVAETCLFRRVTRCSNVVKSPCVAGVALCDIRRV